MIRVAVLAFARFEEFSHSQLREIWSKRTQRGAWNTIIAGHVVPMSGNW